ncbi:hypothetical protein C9F11_39295 [Streptomyces sp. YIM 121038]|uniref:hypothetical protein n=1 Tax=unclassified Streptomyces TaxID=2593676 RepID=UPI001161FA56|nr:MULTISPECIES: hypothetical protein [unclassified Streptomyces]QCX81441.1 hypothetical protein C9F11_39295 [Streptomyces sp. YIM 121038]
MTARTSTENVLRLHETGWAKARRLRGKSVRTCLPPLSDEGARSSTRVSPEGNIVRGDD